jgi:hypothetical protein
VITPIEALKITRDAKEYFAKNYEKNYPDVCEKIKEEIEFAAKKFKTGFITNMFIENREKCKNLSDYLICKGFSTEIYTDNTLRIFWTP